MHKQDLCYGVRDDDRDFITGESAHSHRCLKHDDNRFLGVGFIRWLAVTWWQPIKSLSKCVILVTKLCRGVLWKPTTGGCLERREADVEWCIRRRLLAAIGRLIIGQREVKTL